MSDEILAEYRDALMSACGLAPPQPCTIFALVRTAQEVEVERIIKNMLAQERDRMAKFISMGSPRQGEYVPDWDAALRWVARLLKSGATS